MFPNPVNGIAHFPFKLTDTAHVVVELFNIIGQRMATLLNEDRSPGTVCDCACSPQPDFDCIVFDTSHYAAGAYLVRMIVNGRKEIQKMIVLH